MHPALAYVTDRIDYFRAFRRDLHAHPELGFEEHRTSAKVAEALAAMGLEPVTGIGGTGVVASIAGRAAGPSVALRADMDALPITEETSLPWRSTVEGRMHGCGHDGHTTMVLAAAAFLAETRAFDGTVHVVFQPGEEGYAGAKAMIEDGLFRRFPADAVFALHNWPPLPEGTVALNDGPMMAGIDRFWVTLAGRGGHGGHPHQANDPVPALGHLIAKLDGIPARNVDPLKSAVVHVHHVEAGHPDGLSIVSDTVRLAGMVKWYDEAVREVLERRLRQIVGGTAAAFDVAAEIEYRQLYPPTVNAREEARLVADVAEALFGAPRVIRDHPPSMGSEDFAFMLKERPGAYFRLGQGGAEGRFLHNPGYDFNDGVIPAGAALLAAIAEAALARGARR